MPTHLFSHAPLESVAEAQRRARRTLPKTVCDSLLADNEMGLSIEGNVRTFAELGLRPCIGAGAPLASNKPGSTGVPWRTGRRTCSAPPRCWRTERDLVVQRQAYVRMRA